MSASPKWRAWIVLLAFTYVAGAVLTIRNLGVGELRNAARITTKWQPRLREPSRSELDALPARARFMIDSQCNEGGDPRVQRNCFAKAADWMLEDAKEREPRRDLGFAGMAAAMLLGVASWLARRSAPVPETGVTSGRPPSSLGGLA
jgi:hypothetical protein